MPKKLTKEQVYDTQISPLMAEIFDICKTHKIAHVCTFSLDPDEGLLCTSLKIDESSDPPPEFLQVRDILFPKPKPPMMVTVDHGDGSKTINAIF